MRGAHDSGLGREREGGGVSDHTLVDIIAWPKLIRRLHQSADPNAVEAGKRLASMLQQPDRRIGASLSPKPRGGDRQGAPAFSRSATTRFLS